MKKSILFLMLVMLMALVASVNVTAQEIATWSGFKQAATSFTFVENAPCHVTVVAPLFDSYGYNASFYLLTDMVSNWNDWKTVAGNGHEIGNNGAATSGKMSDSEISSAKNSIKTHIPGQNCNTLIYPNCIVPNKTLVAQNYIAGFNCSTQDLAQKTPGDWFEVPIFMTGSQGLSSYSEIVSKIQNAISHKGWVAFMTFGIVGKDNGSASYSPTNLDAISGTLTWLKNNGSVWVSTACNVAMYAKERDASTFAEISSTSTSSTYSLTHSIADAVCAYDYPLSLRVPLQGWTDIEVRQNGNVIPHTINGDYIYFDAVPNGGNIIISHAPVDQEKEVYTVFKDGTLTYFYDDKKDTHPSDAIVELYLPEKYDHVRFATYGDKVKKAVIDPSMEDALLTSFACMFYNWTENGGMHNLPNMETITGLEYLNTSEAKTMLGMFAGCWSLKGPLDFSYFNTSEVTDMYMMFSGCSELTELDLSSFDVSKMESMDLMFSGCKKLQTIYCNTNWASAGISSSAQMFENCENLEGDKGTKWMSTYPDDITYAHPDGLGGKPGYFSKIAVKEIYAVQSTDKTTLTLYYDRKREVRSGVTDWTSKNGANTVILDESMKEARPISTRLWFDSMTKLTEIQNLDYLNTSRVETMEAMFYQCTALTTLDLSSFDMRNNYVTSFMFSGCSSLTTIYCGYNWSANTKLTSSSSMFSGCSSLEGGNGTKYNVANPTDITYAHPDESGKPGYFTQTNESAVEEIYAVRSTDKTTMTLYYDRKRGQRNGVTNWSDYKYSVTNVVLHESMKDARPNSTASWFASFSELTTIEHLEYLNTSEVTDMSNMFLSCVALTSLDVSDFNTSKVTNMKYLFSNCEVLASLDVSRFDTRNVTDMSAMFFNCKQLTTLDVSHFDTRNVTDMSAMFIMCEKLTSLDLTSFDTKKVTNMFWMFAGCPALTTIYCNEDWSVSTTLTSSDDMFSGCTSLVGGNGTNYNDANPKDVTYARPDEDGKKGYFTKKKATAIDNVSANLGESQKLLRNGQIFILRGDKEYTLTGQEVK